MTKRNAAILAYRYAYSFISLCALDKDEDRIIQMTPIDNEREMIRAEFERLAIQITQCVNPTHIEMRDTDKWYLRDETDKPPVQ